MLTLKTARETFSRPKIAVMRVLFGLMLLALAWGLGTAPISLAQDPASDSLQVVLDTLRTSPNVQVRRGGEGNARRPAGVDRVRQRIAQIRGREPAQQQAQQPPASQPPVVIVVTGQASAQQGAAVRPIIIPGSGGRYYVIEDLAEYLPEEGQPPYRIRIQPSAQREEVVPPAQAELTDVEEPDTLEVEEPDTLEAERPPVETPQPAPDTLATPAEETPPVEETPEETQPLVTEPTVPQVERAILETGLFRGIGINFEFDRSILLPEASRTLDVVGEVLQRYPELRIEVAGHTDSAGPAEYNQALSERRAQEVVQYLVRHFDIDPDRLQARGYGQEEPFATNDTPMGRSLNRRVEFVVLNPDEVPEYREDTPQDTTEVTDERLRELIRQVLREELRQHPDGS